MLRLQNTKENLGVIKSLASYLRKGKTDLVCLLTVKNDKLFFRADRRLGGTAVISIKDTCDNEPMARVLPLNVLLDIFLEVGKKEVVEFEWQNNEVHFRWDKFSGSVAQPALSAKDYKRIITPGKDSIEVKFEADIFNLISKEMATHIVLKPDSYMPALEVIRLCRKKENCFEGQCTDGHRLYRNVYESAAMNKVNDKVYIPGQTFTLASMLTRGGLRAITSDVVFKKKRDAGLYSVLFSTNDYKVLLTFPDVEIDQYPPDQLDEKIHKWANEERIDITIPEDQTVKLLRVIRSFNKLSDSEKKVRFDVFREDGQFRLKCSIAREFEKVVSGKFICPVEVAGKNGFNEYKIGFNGKYLVDYFQKIFQDKELKISFAPNNNESPGLFGEYNERRMFLVMPIRIEKEHE